MVLQQMHEIPGTNAGVLISTVNQVTEVVDSPPVRIPSLGVEALPFETVLDRTIRTARQAGWEVEASDIPAQRDGETVYLTVLRRSD